MSSLASRLSSNYALNSTPEIQTGVASARETAIEDITALANERRSIKVFADPSTSEKGNASFDSDYFKQKYHQLIQTFAPPPPIATISDIGVTLQDWEGSVVSVGAQSFTARLLDRTRNMVVDTEVAEIPIERVKAGDKEMLFEGSEFYMLVRRRVIDGTDKHSLRLVFRRPPLWTAAALKRIRAESAEQAKLFRQSDG